MEKKPSSAVPLLTPAQARGLKELALAIWKQQGLRLYGSAYRDAIGELTAKPPSKEHCGGCHKYRYDPADWVGTLGCQGEVYKAGSVRGCRHPDFKPGYCPEGRYDEAKEPG